MSIYYGTEPGVSFLYLCCFGLDPETTIFSLFLLIQKPKHSSSNHGLYCFKSYRPRLFLVEASI